MAHLKEAILKGDQIRGDEMLDKHADWVDAFRAKYAAENKVIDASNIDEIVRYEIGLVFMEVLKDAGVYKCTEQGREAFLRFVDAVNQ